MSLLHTYGVSNFEVWWAFNSIISFCWSRIFINCFCLKFCYNNKGNKSHYLKRPLELYKKSWKFFVQRKNRLLFLPTSIIVKRLKFDWRLAIGKNERVVFIRPISCELLTIRLAQKREAIYTLLMSYMSSHSATHDALWFWQVIVKLSL